MDSIAHTTKWLNFVKNPPVPGRKTNDYTISNTETKSTVGYIEWYGILKQYCFFPHPRIALEKTCMKDIAEFLVKLGNEHAELRKMIDKGIGKTE